MYDIRSSWIALALLVSMLVAIEVGLRVGLRRQRSQTEAAKGHITAVQASFFGVLALLLGFTFSLSLSRYDSRSAAVVDEANAIGTAYLRAGLLPEPHQGEVTRLFRSYVDLRVRSSEIALDHEEERAASIAEAGRLQAAIWEQARQAAAEKPDAIVAGFVQSVNDMIDALGRRDAALDRHVPEVVLQLLYGTFLMAGLILGYASGVAGHRPSFVTYVLVLLIVVLVFIIIDLDRPRRGLIQVSHASLAELQSAIRASGE
jgi:hypothetical protein